MEDLKAVCKLTSGDRQKLVVALPGGSSAEDASTLAGIQGVQGIHVPPAVSLPQGYAASQSSTVMSVIATPAEPGVWAKPPVTMASAGNAAGNK